MNYIENLIGNEKVDELSLMLKNKLSFYLGRNVKLKSGSKIIIKNNKIGILDLNEEDVNGN